MPVQFADNLLLLLRPNGFESLLNDSAAVHLQCERQNISANLLSQSGLLFRGAELEELLNDVVSENISHEVVRGGENFGENELLLSNCSAFQLLLDEARSVLVLGELHDVIGEIPELQIRESVVAEIFE